MTPEPQTSQDTPTAPREAPEIIILGAGPVGMTLALALARGGRRVALVDKAPRGSYGGDPRALALSHGARQLLGQLDAWNTAAATPIEEIHVSQRGGFGRTLMHARDYGLPALGYVLRYGAVAQALDARLDTAPGLSLWHGHQVTRVEAQDGAMTVQLTGPTGDTILRAPLLVHGEGTPYDDPEVPVREYGQQALLAEVRIEGSHGGRAWERFTPGGPLALLPLEDGFAIVFTVREKEVDSLLALDDTAFLAVLQERFGQRHRFTAVGPRSHFPLALRVRPTLVRGREVWVGNSAQTLHPVSGQGFNLGLRDAWELARRLNAGRPGDDPGEAGRLAAYAAGRRADRQGGALFTDTIVRLFSNDQPGLRLIRGLGLTALDLFPGARHFVAKRMIWGARAWP